jgi:hypothetical protein
MGRMLFIFSIVILLFSITNLKSQTAINIQLQKKLFYNYYYGGAGIKDSIEVFQNFYETKFNNQINVIDAKLYPYTEKPYPNIDFKYATIHSNIVLKDSTQGFEGYILVDSLFQIKDCFIVCNFISINNYIYYISEFGNCEYLTFDVVNGQDSSMHPFLTEKACGQCFYIDEKLMRFVSCGIIDKE